MKITSKIKKGVKREIENSHFSGSLSRRKVTWSVEVGDLVECVKIPDMTFAIVTEKREFNNITSICLTDPERGKLLWVNAKKVRRVVD